MHRLIELVDGCALSVSQLDCTAAAALAQSRRANKWMLGARSCKTVRAHLVHVVLQQASAKRRQRKQRKQPLPNTQLSAVGPGSFRARIGAPLAETWRREAVCLVGGENAFARSQVERACRVVVGGSIACSATANCARQQNNEAADCCDAVSQSVNNQPQQQRQRRMQSAQPLQVHVLLTRAARCQSACALQRERSELAARLPFVVRLLGFSVVVFDVAACFARCCCCSVCRRHFPTRRSLCLCLWQ